MMVPEAKVFEREQRELRACLLIRSGKGERSSYLKHLTLLKEQARKAHENYGVVVDVDPYSLWRI